MLSSSTHPTTTTSCTPNLRLLLCLAQTYRWIRLPELFRRPLTDKDNEAVANPAKFHGNAWCEGAGRITGSVWRRSYRVLGAKSDGS
jgi:hypothetical protein